MMPSPQPSRPGMAVPADKSMVRSDFQQLDHEILTVKEIWDAKLGAIVTRMEAMDKAVSLWHEDLVRVPTDVDKQVGQLREFILSKISAMDQATTLVREFFNRVPNEADRAIDHLKGLIDEKFDSIAIQFKERDTRTEQSALQTKTAVDAALQAAEKAVGKQQESNSQSIAKSEANTAKQIDEIAKFMSAENKSTVSKLDDLKQRLTVVESLLMAATKEKEGRSKGSNEIIGYVIGGMLALVGIGAFAASMMHK